MRADGKAHRVIAEALGKNEEAVRQQWSRLGSEKTESVPTEEFKQRADYWRKRATELERETAKLREQRTAVDVLVEQAAELAPKSYAPTGFEPKKLHKKSGGSPQSAVLILSDTHVGAVVRPEQTMGFGEYNFPTFLRRLKRLEESVFSILQDHTTTAIDELVVPIIGDMIDGALQHGSECGQVNTLFTQFYGAGHALAQFLRNLSTLVPKIRVYTCVGNHPRWGTQKKMPTKNRFSNLDHFLYAYLQSLVRDIPKIDFSLNQQPFAEFQIQNWNFLAHHGDCLRGGDKALGIPAHALGRNISAGLQIRSKFSKPGVNYYLFGHLHRAMEFPHALGEVIINGGFPGVDEFGLAEGFTPCSPVQKFFLIHPKFGRSACYDLNLSLAKKEGTPYEIPGGFPAV